MPSSLTIDSKALQEKLKSLSGKTQERIMRTSLRSGAEVFKSSVIENTPERIEGWSEATTTALPPGALKSDVQLKKKAGKLEYDVEFGSETAHVARWVDEGHKLVKGGKRRERKKDGKVVSVSGPGRVIGQVEGTGFFRKSFDEAQDKAAQAVEKKLKDQLNRKWRS
jgi:hypothetical protein